MQNRSILTIFQSRLQQMLISLLNQALLEKKNLLSISGLMQKHSK